MSRFKNTPDVICADGLPVEPGDTVWKLGGCSPIIVTFVDYTDRYASGYYVETGARVYHLKPEHLTHDDPCAGDSWERIEEDSKLDPFSYCKKVRHHLFTFDNAEEFKSEDIVRRCKALAEKEAESRCGDL